VSSLRAAVSDFEAEVRKRAADLPASRPLTRAELDAAIADAAAHARALLARLLLVRVVNVGAALGGWRVAGDEPLVCELVQGLDRSLRRCSQDLDRDLKAVATRLGSEQAAAVQAFCRKRADAVLAVDKQRIVEYESSLPTPTKALEVGPLRGVREVLSEPTA
jgi:hypothetical protein